MNDISVLSTGQMDAFIESMIEAQTEGTNGKNPENSTGSADKSRRIRCFTPVDDRQ